jgi:hypothetical protein
VWFAIRGAKLNLDRDGNVESVLDAGAVLDLYLATPLATEPERDLSDRQVQSA